MNNRYIIYFTEAQMYLFSARTRVRSIEVAKKYTNVNEVSICWETGKPYTTLI